MEAPLQVTDIEEMLNVKGVGSVIVTVAVAVALKASVTITVYVPAQRPLIADVVLALDHK